MKVLFIGYAINMEEASQVYGASVAGNKMQINLLEQLAKHSDVKIKCITIYPTAAYPQGKVRIKKETIHLFGELSSLKIGFLNLKILKQIYIILSTVFTAASIVKKEHITLIVTFNMFPEIGIPVQWIKKRYHCKIVSLLADLPIDDTEGRNIYSMLLRKIFDYFTKKSIQVCDGIIALNSNAVNLYAPKVPYTIVEGGVDSRDVCDLIKKHHRRKNIVYSGALVEYSGIINLIEAMKRVCDNEIVLDIYGNGQLKDYIMQCASKMQNVNYYGMVDNETIKEVQREAFLLVNPRPIDHKISMVTFPSKIMEYMVSGTPVLTTKLNGLSEEYLDKMFIVEDNEPCKLATKINEIVKMSNIELDNKAMKARNFVLEHKTWEKQGEKIYQFLKEGFL